MSIATQTSRIVPVVVAAILLAGALVPPAISQQGAGFRPPAFEVAPAWPTVSNDWVLGEVTSIAVDGNDHVWVLHRPRSIPFDQRARSAPPVLEFDNDGQLLRRWGGPGDGYDWPEREHGICVDAQGYVWISGNGGWPRPAEGGSTDDMILKFTGDGELVMQIGQRGASQGNVDTVDVHQPGDVFVHEPTNELYVADGYGNRRIQWFTTDGTYLLQLVIEGDAPAAPAGFAFSADAEQRLLYVVESANARVLIYDRRSMTQIGVFGSRSAAPGGMDIAHHIAVDSQGNLYTAEIVNNRRAQKFVGR